MDILSNERMSTFFFARVRSIFSAWCRGGIAAPEALHGYTPHFLSEERKRAVPVQKKGFYIGSLDLEELHALRNQVRCTWLRHESLRVVTYCNHALLS